MLDTHLHSLVWSISQNNSQANSQANLQKHFTWQFTKSSCNFYKATLNHFIRTRFSQNSVYTLHKPIHWNCSQAKASEMFIKKFMRTVYKSSYVNRSQTSSYELFINQFIWTVHRPIHITLLTSALEMLYRRNCHDLYMLCCASITIQPPQKP